MHKLFIQFIFIFLGLTANAQNLIYRAPTNRNEIIDVREVADPTLNTKNFVPKSNDAITEINNLPNTPISTRVAFSVSNYPILGFTPKTNFTGSFSLNGLASIKFIDARFDNEKVGFSPVKNTLQKKGYNILGLQITKDPVDWLRESILQKGTINDTTANRVLTIVLQKFWFSNSANDRYTAANPRLVTTLHYHFDIYTSQGIGYYPQKKITGKLTGLYNDGNIYNILTDSLLSLFSKEVFTNNYAAKEAEANWYSPVDFNDYYTNRLKRFSHPEKIPKGVYKTYDDFITATPISDSVDMIVKYNNFDRALTYACQLTAYQQGDPKSCNLSWGYYDGFSLFINTGNGFFIKLIRTKKDFAFFYLKNLNEERIKADLQSSIKIGGSSYQVLKDYTKAYALTYQLDYDTGELY